MSRLPSNRPALYGDRRTWGLVHADALAFLSLLPNQSVDAVVTDPPYGIGFKGSEWDGGWLSDPEGFSAFTHAWAREVRRILKPGGYVAAFGATRTMHRAIAGIEDAGLEIRDQVLWLYGSGAPKSRRMDFGLGTGLKPSYEPIVLARAPLQRGLTTTANLERHGVGALDIASTGAPRPRDERGDGRSGPDGRGDSFWPANVGFSHPADCEPTNCSPRCPAVLIDRVARAEQHPGSKPLSRLFYAAKASPGEREAGLDHLPRGRAEIFSAPGASSRAPRPKANSHPTVKPLSVMRWLVRLVAPPGGLVLDPFTGSGSTGCAALLEGRQFIGLERDGQYLPIARARLAHWQRVASNGDRDE